MIYESTMIYFLNFEMTACLSNITLGASLYSRLQDQQIKFRGHNSKIIIDLDLEINALRSIQFISSVQ